VRWEQLWDLPLAEVRARLRLPADGVHPPVALSA
jgi:ubiquinone biosynthesis protein Coq4